MQRLERAVPDNIRMSKPGSRIFLAPEERLRRFAGESLVGVAMLVAMIMSTGLATGEELSGADQIAALTHHHDGFDKQVTYRSPATAVLTEADVPDGAWTLDEKQTTVVCFKDGNNAVIFTIDGEFYAANGKARQFVDFANGDGILLDSGELKQIKELEAGLHSDLRQSVIDTGLKLCGERSLDETARAVGTAAGTSAMTPHNAVMLQAAMAIRGAELCRFDVDEVAVVDFMLANGIDKDTYKSEIPIYSLIVDKWHGDVGQQDFCHTVLLPQFGPERRKLITE